MRSPAPGACSTWTSVTTCIFLQGGATLQFAMVPMNFLADGRSADYVNTGTWSTNAIQEARVLAKPVRVAASSEDRQFTYIPQGIAFSPDAVYAHITSNNTIRGTQWARFPDTGGVPLVADMSSDFMSRALRPRAVRARLCRRAEEHRPGRGDDGDRPRGPARARPPTAPGHAEVHDLRRQELALQHAPCFAIYAVQLVLKWLEDTVGGLEKMAAVNQAKADRLYGAIDRSSGFYRGTAEPASRSRMNVTFRLPTEALEKQFIDEAAANELCGLKGHRSVGGCRASLYNAVPRAAVDALSDFMEAFARRNG